jgi:hypothetical protein
MQVYETLDDTMLSGSESLQASILEYINYFEVGVIYPKVGVNYPNIAWRFEKN